jgi:chromosome segregation ATPase
MVGVTIHAHDAGMDVDTHLAPPDPSREVPVPIVPNEPPRSNARARTAMLVAVALIAVGGVFLLGRWTTGGERDALAGERDAAMRERSELDGRRAELDRELSVARATITEHEAVITSLEQAAADDSADLSRTRTQAAEAADRVAELEDSNREQWEHVVAVSGCEAAVSAADTALEKWNAMLPMMDAYLMAEIGSHEERVAGEALDAAFVAIDDAERDYTSSSARCSAALDALPDCNAERVTMEVAVEAFTAAHDRRPESEAELVTEGFIRQPSEEFDVTEGDVTPAQGSPCPAA